VPSFYQQLSKSQGFLRRIFGRFGTAIKAQFSILLRRPYRIGILFSAVDGRDPAREKTSPLLMSGGGWLDPGADRMLMAGM
jgi:hypothetical protein